MTPRSSLAAVAETLDHEPHAPMAAPIAFDRGLYGFPGAGSFLLVPASREGLYWLQSTENEALCFVLADPFVFFQGYAVDLPDIDVAHLRASSPADIAVFVTVTLAETAGRASTANLQGPICINLNQRLGRQVILNVPGYGVREPLELPPAQST
jgi:flagellar assembly factor FliW